jgi:anti-sigma regulatory factor (Ser/Thr protein kinase)
MKGTLLRASIANRLDAPARARAALSGLRGLDPTALAKTRLMASELVANGVRHGKGSELLIEVIVIDDTVRCSVTDEGGGFVVPARSPDTPGEHGWGLVLVRRMADRWGVAVESSSVWFELDRATGRADPTR